MINSENKITHVVGNFDTDHLHTDDTDRRVHFYIDFICLYSFIPTIYKPTRITETTATLIDNILTNCACCDSVQNSAIVVIDISDHMPKSLVTRGGTPIETLYGDVPPKWVGFWQKNP